MKKVFLYAYDRINLGDDLFIHTICNRYPNVKFYLWSKKFNKETFRKIHNLHVIDQGGKILLFLNRIRTSLYFKYKAHVENKCDAVVFIGGSIFIEYDNWKQMLDWWDYEACNRNFYILGANFGPYKTKAYRDRLATILNNVEDICFRDKYSTNLFSDVKKVRYAPDILFSYQFPNVKSKKQVFVSVIDCASRDSGLDKLSDNEPKYIELMRKYIIQYVEDGYTVKLASFCKIEKDMESIDKIINSIDSSVKEKVEIIDYDGTNVPHLITAIAESELIIASRFHAAILGFAANKPVLPIVYSDKTINILKDLLFSGRYIDIRKLNEKSFIQPLDIKYKMQIINNIDEVKIESNSHFKELDMLLENKFE